MSGITWTSSWRRLAALLVAVLTLMLSSACLKETAGEGGQPAGGQPSIVLPQLEASDDSGEREDVGTPETRDDAAEIRDETTEELRLYDVPAGWKAKRPETNAHREEAFVERVVDGDTLIVRLNGERERLRLLGINAPESKANPDETRRTKEGDLVSALVSDLLTEGRIMLEFDRGRRDRFDRLLAYVWLDDDTMLNESLVFSGLVDVVRIEPNTAYFRYFKSLAKEAKRLGLGFQR